MRSQTLLTALLGSTVIGSQVANFNISASNAAQYGCNATCYEAFSAGLAEDFAEFGALYDESFYATAKNFTGSLPGDILKTQPINPEDYSGSVPKGIAAYRIQYTSVDLSNNTVPVTGFVAFPYANRTNGHLFRTVAWAHGTSGVFKGCAPSAMPDLYEYGSWSYLIERGYAVIATDYAGLGNNFTGHPYSALSAHANDVFYSVAAARKVFGSSMSTDWMSAGHSEGGGAVWSLAESSLVKKSSNATGSYLGTVALAPGIFQGQQALKVLQSAESSTSDASSSRGIIGELGWAVIGFQNAYSNETLGFLDPTYKKRLELAKEVQACYDSMEAIATDLDIEQIIDLSDDTTAMQALRVIGIIDDLSAVGGRKSHQPVLVVQGLIDVSVLPEVVEYAYNVTCQAGSAVQLQLYPGLDHDPVIPASAPSFLQWMDDRFDGVPARGACSKRTVRSFNSRYMYAPPDED
ncbi:hypothetical protein SVAN01_08488 [Stagonosporopsis vannaccii]|nr:hypothetical protein SVAN01_08488 [Stagonosporopsis vannaccii]